MDESRFDQNMSWAEQNARQAILHDFTDERIGVVCRYQNNTQ